MKNNTTLNLPLEIRSLNTNNGIFEGYASVFDKVDTFGTAIARGAFLNTIKKWNEKNKFPPLLWQHDTDEPVGVFTEISEDDYGLRVVGKLLVEDDPLAKRAYAHLKAGSINGLSIGFQIIDIEHNSSLDVEIIREVDLLEISLVTFPSNELATVTSIRTCLSQGVQPKPKELEKVLRDVGFSRSQAKSFMSSGYKGLTQRDADEDQVNSELANLILNWSM